MTSSSSLPLPKSLFMNTAVKYNTQLSDQEKMMITNEAFLRSYVARVPGTLFMPINDVLGPLEGAPFPVNDDLIHFIFRSAQVKRCIDFKLQAELNTFSEYYFDNYDAQAHDAQGYHHFTAKVQEQMQRTEFAVYNAVYLITLRHLYLDDFLFPYEYVQRSDEETGVFAVINSPICTMSDFAHYMSSTNPRFG